MGRLVIAFLMLFGAATIAVAYDAPTKEDWCKAIYPELREAVENGVLSKREAASVLWNCKDAQQRGGH